MARVTACLVVLMVWMAAAAPAQYYTWTFYRGTCSDTPTINTTIASQSVECGRCLTLHSGTPVRDEETDRVSFPITNVTMYNCSETSVTKVWWPAPAPDVYGPDACVLNITKRAAMPLGCVSDGTFSNRTYLSANYMMSANISHFSAFMFASTTCNTTSPIGGTYVVPDVWASDLSQPGRSLIYYAEPTGYGTRYTRYENCTAQTLGEKPSLDVCIESFSFFSDVAGCQASGGSQEYSLLNMNGTYVIDNFNVALYGFPYQPFWVFFTKMAVGFGLGILPTIVGGLMTALCGESSPRMTKVKKALLGVYVTIRAIASLIALLATYILAAYTVTRLDISGWHRYQIFVAQIANSNVLLATIPMTTFTRDMIGRWVGLSDKITERPKIGLYADIARTVLPSVLLIPIAASHMIPGVFIFIPIVLLLAIFYFVLFRITRCCVGCMQDDKNRNTEVRVDFFFESIGVLLSLTFFPLVVFTNYVIFIYYGVSWVNVFQLDYSLRRTGRYFNAEYFSSYQTAINYVNLVL